MGRTRRQACEALAGHGVAAGPCHSAADVIHDVHVQSHNMIVEMPRTDGVASPILTPGQPGEALQDGRGARVPCPVAG